MDYFDWFKGVKEARSFRRKNKGKVIKYWIGAWWDTFKW
jgi:hypothetical protein